MNTEQNEPQREQQQDAGLAGRQIVGNILSGIAERLSHRAQVGQVLRSLRTFNWAMDSVVRRPDAPAFDLSDAVRQDPKVQEAAVRAMVSCCEKGQYWHLSSLAKSFNFSDEQVHKLAYACMAQQVHAGHLPWVGQALDSKYLSIDDFAKALVGAVDELLGQDKFKAAVRLHQDMVFHTRRDVPRMELTNERQRLVRDGLLAALRSGDAHTAEGADRVFAMVELAKDPDVQGALGHCLGKVMSGQSWYEYRRLIRAYPVSPEIARSKEVQDGVLRLVSGRIVEGGTDEAKQAVRQFLPARNRLDRAILLGCARYIKQGHDAPTFITHAAEELSLTHEALMSRRAQTIATHALAREISLEHPRPCAREWKRIHEFFHLSKERLEQAVFLAIGRILGERPWNLGDHGWGYGHTFCYELGGNVHTGTELGERVRYLPPYARSLIERFSIQNLTHFCEFARLNSSYILHLAKNPRKEPCITREMLPSIRQANLALLDAEQMLEAGVDVARLAACNDYPALWTNMRRHCGGWCDAQKSAIRTMEASFSCLGHDATLAFMNQPDRSRDDLIRGLTLLNRLSSISGRSPQEFSSRIIFPMLLDPKEYRRRFDSSPRSARHFFMSNVLDLAALPEVIQALEHPETTGALRPAIESLRLHYKGPTDVLASWKSFMRFVWRYQATCHRYFVRGAPLVSIYERNGIAPDGS